MQARDIASIELDTTTIAALESALRDAVSPSSAFLACDNEPPAEAGTASERRQA